MLNDIKMHVAGMIDRQGQPRWGTVQSVNGADGTAKVLLQPEGVLSGWLPVVTSMVGAGWGIIALPSPGDQVLVLPDNGYADHGIIIGAVYSNSQQVPQVEGSSALVGEVVIKHQSGSYLRLLNSGKVMLKDASGASIELQNNGTIVMTGDLHITGAVIGGFGGGDQVGLQTHRHPSNGAPPTPGT